MTPPPPCSCLTHLPPPPLPQVKSILARNRSCLDHLVEALLEAEQLSGEEVRALVERHAAQEDLEVRAQAKEAALL